MTSADTPISDSSSCARKASSTMLEIATIVRSPPSVSRRALPNGTSNGSSGTKASVE